jgi:hypothetical protein
MSGISPEDYARLQQHRPAFRAIPYSEIAKLGRGEAYIHFRRASDPRYTQTAQHVFIRPTLVDTGGATLRAA